MNARRLARLLAYCVALAAGGLSLTAQAAEGDACSAGTTPFVPGVENASATCVATSSPTYGLSCGGGFYYNGTDCSGALPASGLVCSQAGYYSNGSSCVADTSSCASGGLPGTYTTGTCNAAPSPTQGMSCGSNTYYNGTSCVVNGASCGGSNVWANGTCVAPPPATVTPTVGGGLGTSAAGLSSSVGVAPGAAPGAGGQQPICVNTSPVVVYGLGISAGPVLCYGTAADLSGTNVYAYHTSSSQSWDGLNVQDLYARGDITALGTLSVYGGAIITSPNQKTGIVVKDNEALIASSDGTNASAITVTPTSATTSVSNGTAIGTDGGKLASVAVTADNAITSVAAKAGGVTTTSTLNVAAGSISMSSGNGTTTSSVALDADQGVSIIGQSSTGGSAAVTIAGTSSATNTANKGVLITGSGQNAIVYDNASRAAGDVPTWADVAIQSKSYGLGDLTLGSAIFVTDYGIQIISPQPTVNQKITNNTGGNTSSGTVVNNNGINSGSGAVINNLGNNSGSGAVTNTLGTVTSGSGSATNLFGGNNGTGIVANSFGTGTGATTNSFGNTNANTTINSTAGRSTMGMSDGVISMVGSTTENNYTGSPGLATNGTTGTTSAIGSGGVAVYGTAQTIPSNSTINNRLDGKAYQNKVNGNLFVDGNVYINGTLDYVASDSATTTVVGGGVSTSILRGATTAVTGSSGIVLKGTNTPHIVVDGNGKLLTTTGVASQSAASMVLTNGYGNTHGLIINETQTTVSGGIYSSSLTLNDAGARFSNSANGRPITVTGVADGRSDFDAVNFRQLRNIAASSAAMANMPGVDANKDFSVGMGLGHHEGETAYAVGVGYRPGNDSMVRASVASGMRGFSKPTIGVGASFSW